MAASPMEGEDSHTETTYSYSMEWKDKLIDSSSFYIKTGHHNPKEFSLKSTIYISEQVYVGKYFFGPALKDKFVNLILFTSDERPERRDIKLHSGLYYHSQDVWNPEVGDIRVQFSYAGKAGDVVSVIGMQVGQELQPYQTNAGDEILILRTERLTVEDMFLEEHAQNWYLTWIVRGIGWMLMFIGANCITELLCATVSRFSFLQDVLVLGLASINLAVSMSVSLIVIALAWVLYRPILGFCFIVAASMPFIYSAIIVYRSDHHNTAYRRLS